MNKITKGLGLVIGIHGQIFGVIMLAYFLNEYLERLKDCSIWWSYGIGIGTFLLIVHSYWVLFRTLFIWDKKDKGDQE